MKYILFSLLLFFFGCKDNDIEWVTVKVVPYEFAYGTSNAYFSDATIDWDMGQIFIPAATTRNIKVMVGEKLTAKYDDEYHQHCTDNYIAKKNATWYINGSPVIYP